MTDLRWTGRAPFTRWAAEKAMQENFILADVGIAGGHHERWNALGDRLTVKGFDALREAIDELPVKLPYPSEYHNVAIGQKHDYIHFFHRVGEPTQSSIFARRPEDPYRIVMQRRLVEYLPFDFIKVDVEGAEKQVLQGCREKGLDMIVGVEFESNGNVSPMYPRSHLATCLGICAEHGILLQDIAVDRSRGLLTTLNVLAVKEPLKEQDEPYNYLREPKTWTFQRLLKVMIVLELYGFPERTEELRRRFSDRFQLLRMAPQHG